MKRSINFINEKTLLLYFLGALAISSITILLPELLTLNSYTDLSDILFLAIGLAFVFPLILILGGPKGELFVNLIDDGLQVNIKSHNFIFGKDDKQLLIKAGESYSIAKRSGRYDQKFKLESGDQAITWKTSAADVYLTRAIDDFFAQFSNEGLDRSKPRVYTLRNQIDLEPMATVNKRRRIYTYIKIALVGFITIMIIGKSVVAYNNYRYYQSQQKFIENLNNNLQDNYDTDLNQIFDLD